MGELIFGRGFIFGPFDGGVALGVVLLAEASASCFLSVLDVGGVAVDMGVVFWDSSGVVLVRVVSALVAEVGGGGGALLCLGALKVVVEVNLSCPLMGVATSVGVPCLESTLSVILDEVGTTASRGVPLLEYSLAFCLCNPSEVGVASDGVSIE